MKLKAGLFSLFFIAIIAFGACQKENDWQSEYQPKFVVEGGIESGDYPYVILTRNSPFFVSLDSAQLADIVIRWAKVTVSDGVNTEILTSKKDTNFFPSYIYKGSEIKGQPGKTYTLTIEYNGFTLKSSTTIPKPVALDSIWFVKKNDSLAQLSVQFSDPPEKNYYKIFTKTSANRRFIPTLISNHDDKNFNGKTYSIQVNQGVENNLSIEREPYFKIGEEVFFKLSTIPKEGFDFWASFQDEILNSSNPLIGSTATLKSNIEGLATGIWCGYGSRVYRARVSP